MEKCEVARGGDGEKGRGGEGERGRGERERGGEGREGEREKGMRERRGSVWCERQMRLSPPRGKFHGRGGEGERGSVHGETQMMVLTSPRTISSGSLTASSTSFKIPTCHP